MVNAFDAMIFSHFLVSDSPNSYASELLNKRETNPHCDRSYRFTLIASAIAAQLLAAAEIH